MTAGRSRPEIATMVVRDFSFHFKHQAQAYTSAMTPMAAQVQQQYGSPVMMGQTPPSSGGMGFLPPPNTVSPRSSMTY